MEKLKLQIIISRLLQLDFFLRFFLPILEATVNICALFIICQTSIFKAGEPFFFLFCWCSAVCNKIFCYKIFYKVNPFGLIDFFSIFENLFNFIGVVMVKITIVFEWIKIAYKRTSPELIDFFFSFHPCSIVFPKKGREVLANSRRTIWKRFKCIFS